MIHNQPYFISDTHFNHENIIKYCDRPFSSIGEMNREIVENWNEKVDPDDHVFHLGDVGLGHSSDLWPILNRLNGKIFLIRGNHERTAEKYCSSRFEWIRQYHRIRLDRYAYYQDLDIEIYLFHYPIERWDKCHYGTIHLHGHIHSGNKKTGKNRFDVGVDGWDFSPVSFKNIVEHLNDEISPIDAKDPKNVSSKEIKKKL